MGFWTMVLDMINRRERVRHIFGAPSSPASSIEKGVEAIARKYVGDVPETDPRCPHCQHAFDVMPKGRRKCPECREWICVSKPPGMKNKRLVTDEKSRQWRLEKAKNEGSFAYAVELMKQGLPFIEVRISAERERLLEYKRDGIKTVSINRAPDACPACRKVSKKRIKIADELRNPRLPCVECMNREDGDIGWCRCIYVPH